MNRRALNPTARISCNWTREVIAVTGGSGGIGEEIVRKLESLGATIAIMDILPPTFQLGKCCHYYEPRNAHPRTPCPPLIIRVSITL
jgi:hypothetical protein